MKKLISVIALVLCFCLLACCTPAAAPSQPAQAEQPEQTTESAVEPAPQEEAAPAAEPAPAVEAPTEVDTAQLANILDYTGSVTVTTEGQALSAYPGMRLLPGDSAQTGEESEAQIELDQDRLIILEQDSEISLEQEGSSSLSLVLNRGSVINDITPGGGGYTLRAGNITMGVLGTIFRVSVEGSELVIDLYEGKLTITSPELTQPDGYVMEGGERVRSDGANLVTGETVSFSDMPQERLDWLRDKLTERDAQEVLDALDEYLEDITTTPEPPPTVQPEPTAESTPAPTPALPDTDFGFPPVPVTPTPTPTPTATPEPPPPIFSNETVKIISIGGCDYSFEYSYIETGETVQSWTPTFKFTAVEGRKYRAYRLRDDVWQMAAGPYTADSPDGSMAVQVKDDDILVILGITEWDSPTVPTEYLSNGLKSETVGYYEVKDKTDDVKITYVINPCDPLQYKYQLALTGDLDAHSSNWVGLQYLDKTKTYALPNADTGAYPFPVIHWFEPAESYRCLLPNCDELWMLGRIILIPETG